MKKITLLFSLVIVAMLSTAQTTVIIKPDSTNAFCAEVIDYPGQLNTNYGNVEVMAAHVWTNGSVTWRMKGFIKFDLSGIPSNAVILSAAMDLYSDSPTTTFSGNPTTSMNGSNNACTVRRIIQPWHFSTITWNNMPADTNLNQVILPNSVSTSQNYLGTDVTQLVQDQLTYGNYGFKIQPITTQPSNSMIFRSSTNANAATRPQLTVVYTTNTMALFLGNDKTSCVGSSIILNPVNTGGIPPFTYSWQYIGDTLTCSTCKNPTTTLSQNSTFICTITDANNTTATDTIDYFVSAGVNQLQATFTNTNISCASPVDTTIANVVNGSLPITYNWGDGATSVGGEAEIHNYRQSGVYIIDVSDSTGCSVAVFDTILNSSVGVVVNQVIRPLCADDSTGVIAISAAGGAAPYQYHWVTGSSDSVLANIRAGAYTVTVTDNNGCSSLYYNNLAPVNDVWGYYVYVETTNSNCTNNGAVAAIATNGVAPYSYLWSDGSTTQQISNITGGTYNVVVTDSSGCSRTAYAQVDSGCASFISGSVYVDADNDCVFDGAESPVTSIIVKASKNNRTYYGYTVADGKYNIQVSDTGEYHLSLSSSGIGCGSFTFCGDTSQNVIVNALGDSVSNGNFAATVSSGADLTLHAGWTASNPGFTKAYWFAPYNHASTAFTGQATVTFTYDPLLEYLYSESPLPVHDSVAHTLKWTLANLPSPTWIYSFLKPRSYFHVPLTVSVGQTLASSYEISPISGDCDTSNNFKSFTEIVTGSLDPNEKSVSPERSISPEDSVLTYTIQFQNTGNDSTWFIILRDTLSTFLDASSVQNIASSHPYSDFNVSGEGILKWTFNPLRLVDSVTNPSGSKGFVMFTVKKKPGLPVGSIIQNKASIYFDYNVPVVTNTVADTVMNILSANVSSVATSCGNANGAAAVAVTGGVPPFSYQWNGSQSGTTLSNLPAGSYEVTVSDSYGYAVTASANVAASTPVSATITADKQSMCASDTATICAPAGFTSYQWNDGGTSECLKAAGAGNYYVTVTDNANCSAESNHLSVSVFAAPTVSISVNGDTLYAYNADSYQWYLNGDLIPNATNNIYIANQSGNYTLEVTDANGCSARSTAVIITTGINEVRGGYINVFPNPTSASGNWNLDVDQSWIGGEVSIFDESGRLIEQFTIVKNRTAITSVKNSGVYLARVVSDKQCYSIRLVRLGN